MQIYNTSWSWFFHSNIPKIRYCLYVALLILSSFLARQLICRLKSDPRLANVLHDSYLTSSTIGDFIVQLIDTILCWLFTSELCCFHLLKLTQTFISITHRVRLRFSRLVFYCKVQTWLFCLIGDMASWLFFKFYLGYDFVKSIHGVLVWL